MKGPLDSYISNARYLNRLETVGRMYWGLMLSLFYPCEVLTRNKMAIKALNEGTDILA